MLSSKILIYILPFQKKNVMIDNDDDLIYATKSSGPNIDHVQKKLINFDCRARGYMDHWR